MAVKLSLVFLFALIAFCWGPGKGKSVQKDTEWLLGHCAGGAKHSDTICLTTKDDPISCVGMAEATNCEKAAGSFSEMAGAQIQDLTDESFARDENREYMCFLPQITEDVDSFIGFVVEIEQLQTYDFYSQVWSFGCSYPKGVTSAEDVEKTVCCRRFSQTFLKDDTTFLASTHCLPPNMTSPAKSEQFEVGKLKTISLANYKANFIDESHPNIVIKDGPETKPVDDEEKNPFDDDDDEENKSVGDDDDAEKLPILFMILMCATLIIMVAFMTAAVIRRHSHRPKVPKGNGDNLKAVDLQLSVKKNWTLQLQF